MRGIRRDKENIMKQFKICEKTCENWRREYQRVEFIYGGESLEDFIRKCLIIWGNSRFSQEILKTYSNYFSQDLLADLFHYFEDSSYTPEWIWDYKDTGDYIAPWHKVIDVS